ncbi:MAG TPA: hypothetical protein ENK43_06770 [Planctomycetes bacterium]|nr:hypothetical protein [Planctomycetota bacterium]
MRTRRTFGWMAVAATVILLIIVGWQFLRGGGNSMRGLMSRSTRNDAPDATRVHRPSTKDSLVQVPGTKPRDFGISTSATPPNALFGVVIDEEGNPVAGAHLTLEG